MPEHSEHSLPHLTLREDSEQISDFLLAGQRLLMKHPQAARELVAAFIEEGRQFAQTPEGVAWMDSLADTELVKRSLLVWEAYGLDLLLETRPNLTPSTWLEMIVSSLANPDLEGILSMLIVEEMRHGTVASA